MSAIRIGVVGVGGMGSKHAEDIAKSTNFSLSFVCDANRERADECANRLSTRAFGDYEEALADGGAEAIIIAAPHYFHPPITIAALARGIHVLVEKPVAVHAADARKMNQAFEESRKRYPGLVYSAMFMLRTYGYWKKIRELLDGGELGRLTRTTWIITDWFRTQYYYDTGGWRATWKGEGGGVLLNQCPHNLDLYQWMVGMPSRIHGFASFGKYHDIEVEDEVTAYFEHDNGMVGHFITTTAESPGTNRLEIVGEKGKLVFEDGAITLYMNRKSMLDALRDDKIAFMKVENWKTQIPYTHHGEPGHRLLIENFGAAIRGTEPLLVPAVEGINSVTLANAILYSQFVGTSVELPLDETAYQKKLEELVRTSTYVNKTAVPSEPADMNASFHA
ncbi:MAG TPA: Gfo/Idh/MocA family oxidoreductase [Spirochaetia bacterium]|nr:Gfo/Idh/MocA family oxidoreductase [Spirochaetia bacterium]